MTTCKKYGPLVLWGGDGGREVWFVWLHHGFAFKRAKRYDEPGFHEPLFTVRNGIRVPLLQIHRLQVWWIR